MRAEARDGLTALCGGALPGPDRRAGIADGTQPRVRALFITFIPLHPRGGPADAAQLRDLGD
jgi:hypothetical protein